MATNDRKYFYNKGLYDSAIISFIYGFFFTLNMFDG